MSVKLNARQHLFIYNFSIMSTIKFVAFLKSNIEDGVRVKNRSKILVDFISKLNSTIKKKLKNGSNMGS